MDLYLVINIDCSDDDFQIYIDTKVASKDEPQFAFKTDAYTPAKGDKYYFLPGVNIPRIKLKDVALKHGVRNVRNVDEATHIFGSNSTLAKMTNRRYEYFVKTADFLEFMEIIKDNVDEYYMEKVTQAFEFYTGDDIILKRSINAIASYSVNDVDLKAEILNCNACTDYENTYCYSADSDYVDLFKTIITKELWSEDALLVHVNGDNAVTIDSDMYDQIADMFKSSDSDNHILAMEIMANSNYKDSLLYLEILFKEFHGTMYNCHTKKHVNFKSLLGYLGKENSMNTNLNDVMNSLTNKGVLTTDMLNVLMDRYHIEIQRNGDYNHFKVKTITVDEDTLALLNTNYTYSVKEDYQPVPVDISEEEVEEFPEIHGNLDDLVGVLPGVALEVPVEEEDLEITDEDIEAAFTNIVRDELKSELIELEEEKEFPEDESVFTEAEDYALGEMISKLAEESEPNNNQKEQDDTDNFEWF
jgi:hypothetical protein